MPLEREQRVIAQHSAAVVRQPDQSPPAGFDIEAELGSAGIQRVLEQLLDDAGRPLDHLSGSDLIRDGVGKNANAAHGPSYCTAMPRSSSSVPRFRSKLSWFRW